MTNRASCSSRGTWPLSDPALPHLAPWLLLVAALEFLEADDQRATCDERPGDADAQAAPLGLRGQLGLNSPLSRGKLAEPQAYKPEPAYAGGHPVRSILACTVLASCISPELQIRPSGEVPLVDVASVFLEEVETHYTGRDDGTLAEPLTSWESLEMRFDYTRLRTDGTIGEAVVITWASVPDVDKNEAKPRGIRGGPQPPLKYKYRYTLRGAKVHRGFRTVNDPLALKIAARMRDRLQLDSRDVDGPAAGVGEGE